ncbi:MAG: trehalose-phosphatase [Chloroflexota bacterium]|nr:trehalose-phosphatase [Dehalococcoidia bacterium]MDW8254224.1 trehalose-phosphatase [Chloroflexota bacterium]
MALPLRAPSVLAPALRRPFGLFLNLNGTIAPIAPHPDAAVVLEPARRVLDQLVKELDLIVVVTGSPVAQARRMVGVPGIIYVGNHGSEGLGEEESGASPADSRLWRAAEEAARRLADPEVFLEAKGQAVAIHFRGVRNRRATRKLLLAALHAGAQRRQYRLIEGRCLIELRPAESRDKGDAVAALLTERGIKGGLYIGDDASDVPAFRAVQRLCAAGGFGIAVGVASDEAPTAVADAADFLVEDVEGVVRILEWLCGKIARVSRGR